MNENTNQSKVKFEVGKTYWKNGDEITISRRNEKSVWFNWRGRGEVRRPIDKSCYIEWINLPNYGRICALDIK